ncbi:hypothetical protein CCC_03197 [Paramagnetospirillum magnetotacticum MS-1]|uniref:Uncharacterized protein n=1 Tax=Paramagnetospirillum magnetotacticum MS-1 TaxID=272627 RepID=A0A0C2YLF8_PARME|nr:hypothetical protein [Paramagnetospirillum magnetotacticum]KIM00595.1 hypothetical protein CCC_03197 [Paramagnetospirillum magnetotacticum MS-1]
MTTDDPQFAKETVTPLASLAAPWSREISFSAVDHESGLRILRMRIKEGRARFTIVDLDEKTVGEMMAVMEVWVKASP